MSRYDRYSSISNDKLHYNITIYPTIDINEYQFFSIITKATDRLDLLAAKYFNNSKLWWLIAIINNLSGDSIVVEPGTTLYIPRNYYKYVY